MYKCRECNAEYKNKPEYCDCGNNTFDFIEDKPTVNTKKTLTFEQKAELISRIFFGICLFFAVLVWFIPITHQAPRQKVEKTVTEQKNIPDISKIWNDTPAYKPKQTEQIEIINNAEPIKLTPIMDNQKKNIIQQNNIAKPADTSSTKPKKQEKVQPKPVEKTIVEKPKTSTQSKAEQPKVESTPKVEKTTYNPNSPEMLRYKTNLRAALFSKFAVGSIQGSGNCSISFSVDKNGKLINRKFTKESDNKSLNDTVYYMLMSVPKFTPPPSSYNEETIHMNFSINSGNYEISIY